MMPADVSDLGEVTYLAITELRESIVNPRNISDKAIELVALSLTRFGWQQPIVVDRDHVIVVGHTRYRAAQHLDLNRVPVVIADDLTPDEIDAYRIVDNRTRDFTTWDLPLLAQELDKLSEEFGDVLALADWEAVATDFADSTADLDLPDETINALDGGFTITAHFHSKADALAAEARIIDMPGAFDVRHNR